MAFAAEWIAGKAKDQGQAARHLFALLFRQHNTITKALGGLSKFCLRFTLDPKVDSRRPVFAQIYVRLTPAIAKLSNNKKYSLIINSMVVIFTVAFSTIYLNTDSISAYQNLLPRTLKAIATSLLCGLVGGFFLLFLEIYSQLILGYKKQEEHPIWMKFRIWHAICAAAHLERSAMSGVIGEKSLRLLEEVANQESRPWTIAESLEKLKARSDAP